MTRASAEAAPALLDPSVVRTAAGRLKFEIGGTALVDAKPIPVGATVRQVTIDVSEATPANPPALVAGSLVVERIAPQEFRGVSEFDREIAFPGVGKGSITLRSGGTYRVSYRPNATGDATPEFTLVLNASDGSNRSPAPLAVTESDGTSSYTSRIGASPGTGILLGILKPPSVVAESIQVDSGTAGVETREIVLIDQATKQAIGKQESVKGQAAISIDTPLSPGTHSVQAVDRWTLKASPAIPIVVAGAAGAPLAPIVRTYSDTAHIPPSQTVDANPISVFDGYLRLRGQNAVGGRLPLFASFRRDSAGLFVREADIPTQIVQGASGTDWDALLQVPSRDNLTRRFVAVATGSSGQLAISGPPVEITSIATTIPLNLSPPLTLALRRDGTTTDLKPGMDGRFLLNSRAVVLALTGSPDNAYAAVFRDDQAEPIATSFPVRTKAGAVTTIATTLPDGPSRLKLALLLGSQVGPETVPIQVEVGTTPPAVAGVTPDISPSRPGPFQLAIRFRGGRLDPTRAATVTNYVLQKSGGTGLFPEAPTFPATSGGNLIVPDVAELDGSGMSVTLHFANLPVDVYRLAIRRATATPADPGLADVFGNPLDGPVGQPDRPFLQGLRASVATPAAAAVAAAAATSAANRETAEIPPARKAPFVAYPEFTRPRDVPPGFNPSDHVETRVSRLYYYRDAHRVAQIINRHLESYNRAAVDTRRRLATESRRDADQKTDERRSQEANAVRAAQEARAAERQLESAQAGLVQTEADSNALPARIQALQDQISQLSTQANPSDPAADAERQRKLSSLKALLATTPPPAPGRESMIREMIDELEAEQVQSLAPATRADPGELAILNNRLATERERARSIGVTLAAQQRSVSEAQVAVQAKRATEVEASQALLGDQQKEDRAREEQFRLEVAAAHEDPDSFAPGVPNSDDPVEQVSVAVIGEGLIQLRGPLKGVNIIRTMINEIDSPAGQVRIAVHKVQVNGEHGSRMEVVAGKIRDYIDHSRFLTMQSSQMLRNAVVRVAARTAVEAAAACPPGTSQEMRDAKYLDAFFGKDFVDELREIDSEFLRTGNKVLSLHSMDTTSLASALFILALAKNEKRMEILGEFQGMMTADLPAAELTYYSAGGDRGKKHKHNDKFQMFAQNARFQSFLGYFNHDVSGTDTLNPVQREFVRLAQIFKSRLVTEMELNQRVKERALIEERDGDPRQEQKEQRRRDDEAKAALERAQNTLNDQVPVILSEFEKLNSRVGEITGEIRSIDDINSKFDAIFRVIEASLPANDVAGPVRYPQPRSNQRARDGVDVPQVQSTQTSEFMFGGEQARLNQRRKIGALYENKSINLRIGDKSYEFRLDPIRGSSLKIGGVEVPGPVVGYDLNSRDQDAKLVLQKLINEEISTLLNISRELSRFRFNEATGRQLANANSLLEKLAQRQPTPPLTLEALTDLRNVWKTYDDALSRAGQVAARLLNQAAQIKGNLVSRSAGIPAVFRLWSLMRTEVLDSVRDPLLDEAKSLIQRMDASFKQLLQADLELQFARQRRDENRRPLDHRKMLDMLIDEMQEKYIELLEGTRAHTANVDNHIKMLATALEDDFNTQFYLPAFRQVREASRMWDVNLGQIEVTSILTNNRMFAKVSPQATMEFDLPKRDIAIVEGMQGAKAMVDEYGALLNDPTFLSLAKLRSGQPTSSPAQGTTSGGASAVRNVLPGLPRQDDEDVLRQAGPGRREFGSALEALIPDPAIYKFETGTGYEIRPVIQPDGQAVVFHFNFMDTTNVREPVRADEKHLGRVKRHLIDTEVQLSNYELREVGRYQVALKASRTSRGVPLFEDIPAVGVLFRPLPSDESSLQENIVMAQSTIFPTLFDLMGLRWAPAVADLDTLRLRNDDFVVRGRNRDLSQRVVDFSASRVDDFLRTPPAERRPDLYRSQETTPHTHPNGYSGPGLNLRDSHMIEGYDPRGAAPPSRAIPGASHDIPDPTLPELPGTPVEGQIIEGEIVPGSVIVNPPGGMGRANPPASRPGDGQLSGLPPLPPSSSRVATAPRPTTPTPRSATSPGPARPTYDPRVGTSSGSRPSTAPAPARRAPMPTPAPTVPGRGASTSINDTSVRPASTSGAPAEPAGARKGILTRLRGGS